MKPFKQSLLLALMLLLGFTLGQLVQRPAGAQQARQACEQKEQMITAQGFAHLAPSA